MKKKNILVLISVCLVVLAISIFSFSSPKAQALTSSDDSTITPLNSDAFSVDSLKGKVHIINFWATWCGPCRIEIPELIELKESLKDQPFEIIGVSTDDSESAVKRFMKKENFNYPITMYSEFFDQNFGSPRAIPTTYIVDKNFNAVRKIEGYQTGEYLKKIVTDLLNE